MKTIIEMAREAKVSIRGHYDEMGSTPQELERFADLIRADEREVCAKFFTYQWEVGGTQVAEAILARGNK